MFKTQKQNAVKMKSMNSPSINRQVHLLSFRISAFICKNAVFLFLILILCSTVALATDPVDKVVRHRLAFAFDDHVVKIPYERNYSLSDTTRRFTRAIIVLHGTSRNADDYYLYMLGPAKFADHADLFTLIIAPQFLVEEDVNKFNLPDDVLFWSSGGWKRGDLSRSTTQNPRPVKISSFAIMDSILMKIATNQPHLERITIAGHSAGGQFVNRYAAGNRMEQVLQEHFGLSLRYIVANPSSYVYFNKERRVGESENEFVVPSHPPCRDYNDYKYGLDHLNNYMDAVGPDSIRAQYRRRQVVYLLGSEDNDPNHSSLDTSCPATMQGRYRLERGNVYYNYMQHLFGEQITDNQTKAIVEGVGHSSSNMFRSPCGQYFLFDYGSCTTANIEGHSTKLFDFQLEQNYPNPFNANTTIRFRLMRSENVWLSIHNVCGQHITTLIDGQLLSAGEHATAWNAMAVPSGLYCYQLKTAAQASQIKKLILLK